MPRTKALRNSTERWVHPVFSAQKPILREMIREKTLLKCSKNKEYSTKYLPVLVAADSWASQPIIRIVHKISDELLSKSFIYSLFNEGDKRVRAYSEVLPSIAQFLNHDFYTFQAKLFFAIAMDLNSKAREDFEKELSKTLKMI